MSLEDLFNSIVGYSCGLCCSEETQCPKCVISCLRANGLPESLAGEITGLKQKSRNHGNGFQYSELYKKLIELREAQK